MTRGREVALYDVDPERAASAAGELGARVATREEALGAHLLVTMTPGHEILLPEGSLQPGQHVSLMGADGPGKAEIAVEELVRTNIFCDDWEQASHNGELVHAVEAGVLSREQVTEVGAVLVGDALGRTSDDEITSFDSTGLAIQDLAIALVATKKAGELELPTIEL
jgi:alanine dehydrogenase